MIIGVCAIVIKTMHIVCVFTQLDGIKVYYGGLDYKGFSQN